MDELSLIRIRIIGMRTLLATIVVLTATAGAVFLFADNGAAAGIAATLSLALCIYPALIVLRGRTDAEARISMTITAVALPSLLLFACEGLAWQTDLHTIFFAALAMTAILCDWKALIAGTLTVAVHHLVVGLLVPHWLFIGQSSLPRILLHAVVLLAEAGALVWLAAQIVKLIDSVAVREEERRVLQNTHDREHQTHMEELKKTIAAFGHSLDALKQGDLTTTITAELPDQYAVLKTDFNSALTHLRKLIKSVSASAATISAGSEDIVQGSDALAKRTETNAASLEETARSVALMDERLRNSVQSASGRIERADQAIATMDGGRAVADEAVQAMNRVSENAKGIDSVIEGLDKIAFQTRVLAMNAAVEAGRAGEAGRGFAVVADLVSALAMRAEEEAKRARDQLTATQTDIVHAQNAVKNVDLALQAISDDVGEVHHLLTGMASDNQEQSAAITQISATIGAMDRATQQNAAMVQETTNGARNLAAEIAGLAQQARRFTVDADPQAASKAPGAGSPRHRSDRQLAETAA